MDKLYISLRVLGKAIKMKKLLQLRLINIGELETIFSKSQRLHALCFQLLKVQE